METLENAVIRPYFDKMYLPILAADIIISRAGSLSISEILAAKNRRFLYLTRMRQLTIKEKNAREIEKTGAALISEDADLTPEIPHKNN